MVEDNVQLIRRILSGDEDAFTTLIQKHQKSVHALVWRKIGDFHIAEEITQDTFIQVYKRLATLEDPHRFEGWLYVIANRLCINWIQRDKAKLNRLNMQSLEAISEQEIEESSYRHHVSDQRKTEDAEYRYEIAKKILATLPESERTVATLYYLGEMTVKEIGKFLGVSVNTIKSRLRRARERLQADKEHLISETLSGVQLSTNITENVLRRVADLKLTPPVVKKPLLPWMAVGAATFLVVLLLGVGNQYLLRFQQPYSFEAQSEPTIELVDEPIVLDIVSKPAVRSQIGRTIIPGKNSGAGMQFSETTLATDAWDDSAKFSTSQWMYTNGPGGGPVVEIFATPEKTLYAATPTGIYRLTANETAWILINASVPTGESRMPMAEHAGILYIVSFDEIFASKDKGETWKALGSRPNGNAVGMAIVNRERRREPHTDIVMYLALRDKGIFRSTDAGKQWTPLNSGLTDVRIYTLNAIGNKVFTGTHRGLYCLDSENWRQLPVDPSRTAYSLAGVKNELYVGTGPDLSDNIPGASNVKRMFRSADFGESWTEITPTNLSPSMRVPSGLTISTVGETLLVLGTAELRSRDGGQSWSYLGFNTNALMVTRFPIVAVNENTFYRASAFGVHRTIDGGESWHLFMNGIAGSRTLDFVALNNRLYAHTGSDIVQSADGGVTWKSVGFNFKNQTFKPSVNFYADSKLAVSDNRFYVISTEESNLYIFSASAGNDVLVPVQGVPAFEVADSSTNDETRRDQRSASQRKSESLRFIQKRGKIGVFAVSGEAFYATYNGRLLKWKLGDPEWKSIRLIRTDIQFAKNPMKGKELAVLEGTIYVGNPDGKLLQSLDGGNSWKDVRPNLPLDFTIFKEIAFKQATVYIATDAGVLSSQTGAHWHLITDSTGTRIVIDKLTVNGTTLYGAGEAGVYRLDDHHGRWMQISSSVPGKVRSIVVSNNRLYVATEHRGIFHISLAENMGIADSF